MRYERVDGGSVIWEGSRVMNFFGILTGRCCRLPVPPVNRLSSFSLSSSDFDFFLTIFFISRLPMLGAEYGAYDVARPGARRGRAVPPPPDTETHGACGRAVSGDVELAMTGTASRPKGERMARKFRVHDEVAQAGNTLTDNLILAALFMAADGYRGSRCPLLGRGRYHGSARPRWPSWRARRPRDALAARARRKRVEIFDSPARRT